MRHHCMYPRQILSFSYDIGTGSEETSMNCSCYIKMKKSIANKKESCHFLSYITMVERPKILSGR